jgi:hypothetical protein
MTATQSERASAASKPLERLLTEREYANITGQSLATIRRARLLGTGCPFVKLKWLVRYRPSDVLDYIERNVRSANNDNFKPAA